MNARPQLLGPAGWSVLALMFVAAAASAARGATPQLGGSMKHIFVTLYGPTKTLYHVIQDGADERVLLFDYDETYTGGAEVLNDMHYSGRYGWLAEGSWSIPPQRGIFVAVESQPEGLEVYEENTYDPILGTAGSSPVWQWNTTMVHNWYAAAACGHYEAIYKVYVGDLSGVEDPAYTPTYVTLKWHYVYSAAEPAGDLDGDGDVDLADFAVFQACRTDGAAAMPSICGCFDFDVDEDVDIEDYGVFQAEQTAPGG